MKWVTGCSVNRDGRPTGGDIIYFPLNWRLTIYHSRQCRKKSLCCSTSAETFAVRFYETIPGAGETLWVALAPHVFHPLIKLYASSNFIIRRLSLTTICTVGLVDNNKMNWKIRGTEFRSRDSHIHSCIRILTLFDTFRVNLNVAWILNCTIFTLPLKLI